MFLYCVGFRLFRDVCTDIAGGFSAVGCYISVTIKTQFPHKADTIALHIRNILKSLISKDTQFFLFEWDSLFFLGGAPRITRIARISGFLFFWLHVSRVSHVFLAPCFLVPLISCIAWIIGSAYLAYRLDFWFCLPLLSSYYLPPGGAGQRTGAAGYERDFFCALVLLVL